MNDQQTVSPCRSDWIEQFLTGTLNSADSTRLEWHLTECDRCVRQIQLSAEQDVSWQAAQSLLTPDEFDHPQHLSAFSSQHSGDSESMTGHQMADVLSREIRGWLDPTDDPHSMGRFAGYEIVGIVGHGGMGIVLKGFEASLNRFVAIKILAPRLATNGNARRRFAREAQATAAVRHDNVIAIHRVDEWHGLPFLVMPYAGCISLQKRLDCDGPLSIEQTLRVGVQIASGLAAAHAQGLIHRDIKPANILLEHGVERVTITDFGLARAADDASVTRTGVIAGTPQYMSPEQAEAGQLDARSDLFSLGSVLYVMATGQPPFRGAGSFEVLQRIVNRSARPMREVDASVPEWFENIVRRLHARSPSDRPASAREVAELLEACLAHVQQPATRAIPAALTSVTESANHNAPPQRIKWLTTAVSAVTLIVAGVLIVLELGKGRLVIESDVDDVPIRILCGDTVVDRLTVTSAGTAVRVAAGTYTIEIADSFDSLVVSGGRVVLKRGQTEVVRISQSADSTRRTADSTRRTAVSPPEKMASLPADTQVHVVGCYLGRNHEPVQVRVERTGKPMVIVLTAYHATDWVLHIADDADVRGVILSGYFEQRLSHVTSQDLPTRIFTWFPLPDGLSADEKEHRHQQCFYVWSPLLEDFGKMQSLIRDITDRDVNTFQGVYSAKAFVIDDQKGLEEFRLANRWQNLWKDRDRKSVLYQKTLRELQAVQGTDESGLSPEHLKQLDQLMDRCEPQVIINESKIRNPVSSGLRPPSPPSQGEKGL